MAKVLFHNLRIIAVQLSDIENNTLHAPAGAIKEVMSQIAQPAHR
jgi:hypothetical protein